MEKQLFGYMPSGEEIFAHILQNESARIKILNLGGVIQSFEVFGRDIVAGFDTVEDYLADDSHQGGIIGRVCNRIRDARFTLNGKTYQLTSNVPGGAQLHGGNIGFDRRVWTVEAHTNESITLSLISPDGEEGYPGNLYITVTYTLKNDALSIEYTAKTDADTVINLTNHAYFNIGGVGKEKVREQTLTLYADAIAEVNEILVPSGKLLPTAGTPFDFNTPKKIGRDIDADDRQIKMGGGYDHGFRITQNNPCAILHSDLSGITMEIDTTEGGIQMYTGNFMTANNPFFGTTPQTAKCAVALECNKLPDSPNRPEFPSCVLLAGEVYTQKTTYRFF